MTNDQFVGTFFVLLLSMFICEIGMLTICDRLKTIVRLLEEVLKAVKDNAAD